MSQALPRTVSNQFMPTIAQALSVPLTLIAGTPQQVDLTPQQSSGRISAIQSVYVDNSANSGTFTLTTSTGQNIVCPPQSQGMFPCLVTSSPVFTAAGSGTVSVIFLNVPMPAAVWSINGGLGTVNAQGQLQVADSALDSTVSGGALVTAPRAGALISGSTTSPATAASTQLFAAYARRYLAVQAPTADDLWLNINGGAASIGGLDCVRIPAGTFYEFREFVSQSAIYYYTAATSTEFAAFQA